MHFFFSKYNNTANEQFVPCKARCKFIQYMVNISDNFGLKFYLAADVKKFVLFNRFLM